MKKSSEENKGLLGGIKAFYQTKIGKMTFFFGFYFFFFLFLAFFLKGNIDNSNNTNNNGNSDNSTVNENVNKNPSNELFNTELLINDNYYYKYEVTGDEKSVTFEGRINDKNDLLKEYAYNYFLNIYNIRQIIKNSKYLSREEVEGVIIYNYEVTTSTIMDLQDGEYNGTDGINKIIVKTDSNFVVTSIEFDLSDYMQKNNNYNEYKIILNYRKG